MTSYTRTMREAREEMNEDNLAKMRKAAGGAKQTLKMKDGSIGMDSFTASAIMQIYDKVNDKNRKTMENLLKGGKKADIVKLMKFAMSKVNAEYVPEEFEEEVELDEDILPLFFALWGTGAMVVLPALMIYDVVNRSSNYKLDAKVGETVGKLLSKFKKNKNYKPNSAEIDASKKLEKEVKSKEPSIFKKAMSKLKSIKLKKEEVDLDEKLDKEDEPTIKKVVKMLKKASKAHAGQADNLEKAVTEKDELDENLDGRTREYRQHRERLESLRAKRLEARDMDPADIDTSATDDDIKSADKNIMMQLRKSVSLRGQYSVEFLDKKKVKVPQKIALAVIAKYNSLRKPMDKEKFQAKIAKSHKDLLMGLKESLDEKKKKPVVFKGTPKQIKQQMKNLKKKDKIKIGEESTLDRMNKKLQEKKNG